MANLYEDILSVEHGENILQSIDEGLFKMRKFRETLAEGAEGALHLGPERDRIVADLTSEENERYKADIRATNILLQEGSELTKDERESQLYDDFEHFRQNKGETIHENYVRFTKLINDMRNIKMTMSKMQLNSKSMNNMLPEWGRFVTAVKLNRRLKTSNYDQLYAYLKQHEARANENKMMLKRYNQYVIDPLAFVSNVEVDSYEDWITWFVNLRLSSKHKHMLEGVFYVTWWHLWTFRNKLIFDSKPPSQALFFDDLVSMSFHWCQYRCKASFSWNDWLKNPHLVTL
ncbi:hypothetical protein Tco_0573914 [Tanacetum coccineum]